MSPEVFSVVSETISQLFLVPQGDVGLDSSMETIEPWDSLQHINLIMDLEEKFNIQFEINDVPGLRDVRSLVAAIERQLSSAT